MAHIIPTKTIETETGFLTVIEKNIPFPIKRIFYLTGITGDRGKHSHKITYHALTCVQGSCKVEVCLSNKCEVYTLDSKDTCLILDPPDWHRMFDFSPDAILLAMASEEFDPEDYVY